MEVFVGRQPILDRALHIHAYELLFRPPLASQDGEPGGAQATAQLVAASLLTLGVDRVLGGRRGFINFPRQLIVDGRASCVPASCITIELLENVPADAEVIDACRGLKNLGYTIALDDFVDNPGVKPLVELADILKVDFLATGEEECLRLASVYRPLGKSMLAEKIETRENYKRAFQAGYVYFQGYFFARPVIVSGRDVPGTKLGSLRLIAETQRSDLDFGRLEALLKNDVSLTFKLLRYVNSSLFHWRQPIRSIMQALVALGEREMRRWIALAALWGVAQGGPGELVVMAMTRARFCELIANRSGYGDQAPALFLMGMFSLLDAMIGRPLEELLSELNLSDEVRDALLQPDTSTENLSLPAETFALVLACETTDWAAMNLIASRLSLASEEVCDAYLEALTWSAALDLV